MARYIERAENTARMLDVNYQMSLLPQSAEVAPSAAGAACCQHQRAAAGDYRQALRRGRRRERDGLHGQRRRPTRRRSVSCLRAARENARAVRGTLTTEMWETQNQTWLEFQRMLATGDVRARPGPSSSTGSSSARTCRAASPSARCCRTRRSTSCASARFLERADNTARMLDVKFHARAERLLRRAPASRTRSRLLPLGAHPAHRSPASRSTARSTAT